jgi:hypothetical protein
MGFRVWLIFINVFSEVALSLLSSLTSAVIDGAESSWGLEICGQE